MTLVRAARPTDLVALVSFDGRVYPNEAKTRERMGKTNSAPHPLERALEQWFSFATGCHTWISVKGATLRGLISARRRSSHIWEIDCLINAAEDDSTVCIGLLEQALRDAGRAGVEKVFLRLTSDSAILPIARKAGFIEYLRENLYSSPSPKSTDGVAAEDAPHLRKALRSDQHALYQLYSAVVPEPVRQVEAMTFSEWRAVQDRRWLVGRVSQLVIERDGQIRGWVSAAGDTDIGRLDLMASPKEPGLETLLDSALRQLAGREWVHTIVPTYATALAAALQRRGFQKGAEYSVLAKSTTTAVKAAQLAPAT